MFEFKVVLIHKQQPLYTPIICSNDVAVDDDLVLAAMKMMIEIIFQIRGAEAFSDIL